MEPIYEVTELQEEIRRRVAEVGSIEEAKSQRRRAAAERAAEIERDGLDWEWRSDAEGTALVVLGSEGQRLTAYAYSIVKLP